MVKILPANAENTDLIPDRGRFHVPWSNDGCVTQLLNLCSRDGKLQLRRHRVTIVEARAP